MSVEEHLEDQIDEFNSLMTIYKQKLEEISSVRPYQVSFLLQCAPKGVDSDSESEKESDDESDAESESESEEFKGYMSKTTKVADSSFLAIRLKFHCSDSYPEEAPSISIHALKGLGNAEAEKLTKQVSDEAEENVGETQIFDLVTFTMDLLYELRDAMTKAEDDTETDDMNRFMTDKELAGDFSRGTTGTPVTRENFAEWAAAFEKEMKESTIKTQKEWPGKMSGLSYFQQKDAKWIEQVENSLNTPQEQKEQHVISLEVDDDLFLDEDDEA